MAWTGRRIRPLDTEPTARVFDPIPVGEREYLIDDLAAAPSAVTIQSAQGTLVATLDVVEDLVLLPRNRQAWEPIRRLRVRPGASAPGVGQTLTVTGLWGWPQVPADVRQAAIDTAIEWLKAHQALSNPSPDQFEPGTPPARALPLTARNLLGPYRRMGVA
jgi:hypothetical protein